MIRNRDLRERRRLKRRVQEMPVTDVSRALQTLDELLRASVTPEPTEPAEGDTRDD